MFIHSLPEEMTREILRRLPIRSIMRCKYVCKSWRGMIEGGDFEMLHTPQQGLAFIHRDMGFEVCDEACEPLCHFGFPRPHKKDSTTCLLRVVLGSTNGLILVWNGIDARLCVCNPITSEYIKLPPQSTVSYVYGFGVSKLSGQYKILCGAHVYTLGREGGCWRGIAGATGRVRMPWENAVFINGNLHWLAFDSKENPFICCFDLETELCSNLLFSQSADDQLYIYSKNTERHVKNAHLRQYKSYFYNIVTYIPSFLSLTAMGIPNVQSLSFY